MNAQSHLEKIKSKLAGATTIAQITVVQEYALQDRGFFRARLVLTNGDFVEVSEFFTIVGGQARLVEYRHQWMDSSQQILRKRWDNARHYPDLPNHPHHIHIGGETHVEPGRPLGIVDVVDVITEEVSTQP
ncbi:MAG: DUF6516 family protein [Anaerolineae bacterium]|uniref:toxin-antitoxin system TumE family protein n=1 Tax=Candidatus Amarolinea dominans TaxID=3140696 RepID=UPI003134FF38|nr:hypothetical protein [Anaerolineae bacterium]MBK9091380.1 hypothetical protein [Anaerolineae bacterium]